jgi:hypothetical protein
LLTLRKHGQFKQQKRLGRKTKPLDRFIPVQ